MSVAEQVQVEGGGFATVPGNIVAEAHTAARDVEAFKILEKRVKAAKRRFDRLFTEMGIDEMRDAAGNRVATMNYRAPSVINQERLRDEYPKIAEAVTEPNEYTYVSFP